MQFRSDPLRRLTVRNFNCLSKVIALAALVLLGHPDTLRAQSLTFTPSSVTANITGPGGTFGPQTITVSGSSLSIPSISTSDHTNWLCAVVSGSNTINVGIGTGGCSGVTTTQLSANVPYTGDITVTS